MAATVRSLLAVTAAIALLLTGCSRDITGTAVTAAGTAPDSPSSGDGQCATVSTPLEDIPSENDEPRMRIPVPTGWERNDTMDSKVIRYAIVAQDLATSGFAPNAVVTLESVTGTQDADEVFEQNRDNLVTMLGAFDLSTESNSTCGFPSETTRYTAPAMGPAPERPIIMHAIVASTDNSTYLATLTIQTADGNDPTYERDSAEIVDGFQMRAP
jgi:hypothetical protein